VDATGTLTGTETATATVEAGAAVETPQATAEVASADATPAATAEAGATADPGTPAQAQGSDGLFGIPTAAVLPLGLTYLLGFIIVFALWRRRFNRNKV
jgi:hypothetical protein